jgi:hypothetical protein
LEKWLRQQAKGFDIEIVEVKGTPPVIKYRDGGLIESITFLTRHRKSRMTLAQSWRKQTAFSPALRNGTLLARGGACR